jgi:hypothetical protein
VFVGVNGCQRLTTRCLSSCSRKFDVGKKIPGRMEQYDPVLAIKANRIRDGIQKCLVSWWKGDKAMGQGRYKHAHACYKAAAAHLVKKADHVVHLKSSWSNQVTAKLRLEQECNHLRQELSRLRALEIAEDEEVEDEATDAEEDVDVETAVEDDDDEEAEESQSVGGGGGGGGGDGANGGNGDERGAEITLLVAKRLIRVVKGIVPVVEDGAFAALYTEVRPVVSAVPLEPDMLTALTQVFEGAPQGVQTLENEFARNHPNFPNGYRQGPLGDMFVKALELELPVLMNTQAKCAVTAYDTFLTSLKDLVALGGNEQLPTRKARSFAFGLILQDHLEMDGYFGCVRRVRMDGQGG